MTTPRDDLTAQLWAVHAAAMDAANDPSQETIREVRKAYRAMERALPAFWSERTKRLMEVSRAEQAPVG